MNIVEVIQAPLVTEKLEQAQQELRQYAFEVDRRATKADVRAAVEKLFKVKVIGVRTAVTRGKPKRLGRNMGYRPNWKKAIVTLKEGEKIELFAKA